MISEFKDIIAKIHPRYTIELSLIFLALIISLFSLVFYRYNRHSRAPQVLSTVDNPDNQKAQSVDSVYPSPIYVDVSGAVANQDVFEVTPGARLKEVIELAGGMTDLADKNYVYRNYNLAKFVGDQEKIYIPYYWDITNGTFVEEKRILEYLKPLYLSSTSLGVTSEKNSPLATSQTESRLTISLNSASIEELDTLPGVGPVTAQKIVDNRPYTAIEELISKRVVNQSTFGKLKDLITP